MLNSLPQVKETFDNWQEKGLFPAIESALDMVEKNPELYKFFASNPAFIPNIAKGVIENTESVKAITDSYKFDNSILDILSTMMDKPEIAKSIVADVNKGDYIHLIDTLINTLNNPEIKLRAVLQTQAKDGLFNKLIDGVIEQHNYQPQLEQYGLAREDLPQIAQIFPILLDKPKELQEVFTDFKEGNYTEMVKKLIVLGGETPEIKQYLTGNKELFVKVLNHSLKQSPALSEVNIEDDLYNILPALLNHPKELTDIVTLSEQGKYGEVGKKFFDLIQSDPSIKEYFLNNASKFKQISEKIMGLGVYGVKDEVSKIFDVLLAKDSQPKIKELLDLYEDGNWNELIKSTCKFMEDDPAFNQYIQENKGNFSKIITAVIDKAPAIKTYTSGANVGDIAAAILKDPKSIRELVESYENGIAATVYTLGKKVLFDSEFRAALATAATGWLLGEGGKQQLVDGIKQELSARGPSDKLVNLSDFVQKFGKDVVGDNEQQKQKLAELTGRNTLFDGVRIGDSYGDRLKLENLEIKGLTFVNSNIENVSFKGSVFQSVSFTGASFSNVDFTGATIDGDTLRSMTDSLKKGNISLDGAILVGDLSGMSLRGANLIGVTSMRDVNLKDADLSNATLPAQPSLLLTETYNLDKAKFTEGVVSQEIALEQKDNVITKAVEKIAEKANENKEVMTAEQKDQLVYKLRELSKDSSEVGAYVKEVLELTPSDIITSNFPIGTSKLSNVFDYLNKTSDLMTILYNHKDNPEMLKDSITANLMADKVTEKLFGLGANRGQDGIMIRQMMQQVVKDFRQENSDINVAQVGEINADKFLTDIADELRSKSKYTTAGMLTSGIYLPKEVFNDSLINAFKVKMNDALGQHKFNDNEAEIIRSMADRIGANLFGVGSTTNRKADTDLIHQNLKNAFYQIKLENNNADLSGFLQQNLESMVGTVEKGWTSTNRTGLTKLYFENANYTSAGLISGGIYLDPAKVGTNDFIKSAKTTIKDLAEALKSHISGQPAGKERVNSRVDGKGRGSF